MKENQPPVGEGLMKEKLHPAGEDNPVAPGSYLCAVIDGQGSSPGEITRITGCLKCNRIFIGNHQPSFSLPCGHEPTIWLSNRGICDLMG